MNIFIDLDGTLVDIKGRHYRVYKLCCEEMGGSPLSIDEYWNRKRDNCPWSEVLQESSISFDREIVFLHKFIGLIERPEQLACDQLFEGVKEALEGLGRSNVLFLLSLRRNHTSLIEQVNKLGIDQFFFKILSGHSDTKEGTLSKKADIISSVEPRTKDTVVVGDTEADIVAAKSVGAISVGVLTGIRSKTYLSNLKPDYLVDGIVEVAKLFT